MIYGIVAVVVALAAAFSLGLKLDDLQTLVMADRLDAQVEYLHHTIAAGLNCDATLFPVGDTTLPPANCASPGALPSGTASLVLRDRAKQPLFGPENAIEVLGSRWEIAATCDVPGKALVIRAARYDAARNVFLPHPVFRDKLLDYTSSTGLLFKAGDRFCTGSFGGAADAEIVGAQNVLADDCPSGKLHAPTGTCAVEFKKQVTFPRTFNAPPTVTVIVGQIPANPAGSCPSTEDYIARAENVTKTGFTLVCAGHPQTSDAYRPSCSAKASSFLPGRCGWLVSTM